MKRIAILLAVVAMFASTAAIALADDDGDTGEETSEPRLFNEAGVQKADALAGFLLSEPSAAGEDDDKPIDEDGGDLAAEEAEAVEQILDLRYGDRATGWGAIFKLIQLAKASDTSLSELVLVIEEEGGGWAFGRRFKAIEEPRDPADDAPRNFGQLKKQLAEENGTHGKKPEKPKKPKKS